MPKRLEEEEVNRLKIGLLVEVMMLIEAVWRDMSWMKDRVAGDAGVEREDDRGKMRK